LDLQISEEPGEVEDIRALDKTRPWGEGNPQPAFCWGPVAVKGTRVVGKSGDHIQVTLGGPDGNLFKGIGFSMSKYFPSDGGLGRRALAAGHFIINNWQGQESVEFQLRDIDFNR
jgi:hypothetical protein